MKKSSNIPVKNVDSLEGFITEVEKICLNRGSFLFRGQLYDDELKPRFFREDTPIKLKTKKTEDLMLKDFKKRGRPFLVIEPQSEYEWLALAQHHGMPTRFLDWTSSALAALWFVVVDNRIDRNDNGVVWILKFDRGSTKNPRKKESPFNNRNKNKYLFHPTHIEKRFVAQGGWFSIHYNKRPLEGKRSLKSKLKKIIIPRKQFSKIKYTLNLCGMNQIALFPDYGGLSKHIAWQNSIEYLDRKNQ